MPSDALSPEVRWDRPSEATARIELDRWCRAVGPPAVHRPPGRPRPSGAAEFRASPGPTRPAELEGVAVVAWNTHVGAADVDGFIEHLRNGHLTEGRPVRHFVLLLQEVYRAGDPVPGVAAGVVRSADRVSHPASDRRLGAVDHVARRHGLHLFYAPSMRNGHLDEAPEAGAEDRGNAILATLPLTDLQVVELPVSKQRRIAVAATVRGEGTGSGTWSLRVVSVHLDHMSGWRRLHRSMGQDRAAHARLLVDAFGHEEVIAVGGDFNSWFGGAREAGVRLMRDHFPLPSAPPGEATLLYSIFPLSRHLDHLFFRLPEEWSAEYRVVPHGYGSDHLPLVGWIRSAPSAAAAAGLPLEEPGHRKGDVEEPRGGGT